MWTEVAGSWSVSSGKLNVDSVPGSAPWRAILEGPAVVDDGTYQVTIKLSKNDASGGLIFSKTGAYWSAEIEAGSSDNIKVRQFSANGTAAAPIAQTSATISTATEYVLRVQRIQRHVVFDVIDSGTIIATIDTNHDSDFGDGTFGVHAPSTYVEFDDFSFTRMDTGQTNPAAPRWSASSKTTLAGGELTVETPEWGGVSKLEWAGDDDYMAQADVNLNTGDYARLLVRYADPDNYYAVELGAEIGTTGVADIELLEVVRGKESTLASDTYTVDTSVTLKVSIDGTTVKAWVDGTLEINTNGSEIAAGGVALASEKAKFDDVLVFYDVNTNGSYDAGTDDLISSNGFGGTTISPTHDASGNLTDDGTYKYTCDPWNP